MILCAHQDTPAKVNVQKNAAHPKRAFDNLKTPGKANIASPNVEKGATPENPWVIGESGRSGSSSGIDISPGSVLNKGKEGKEENMEKFTEVTSGKRKRTIPKKFSSPYALDQPSRRPTRGTRPSGSTVSKGTVTTFPSVLFFSNIYNYCIYLFMNFVCSSEL